MRTGPNGSAAKHVREIKRQKRQKFFAKDKIRIALDGLRGESSISELGRPEGIAESLYNNWSKEFLEAGKKRLLGDTAWQATSGRAASLKRGTPKEVLAETRLKQLPLISGTRRPVNEPTETVDRKGSGTFRTEDLA